MSRDAITIESLQRAIAVLKANDEKFQPACRFYTRPQAKMLGIPADVIESAALAPVQYCGALLRIVE